MFLQWWQLVIIVGMTFWFGVVVGVALARLEYRDIMAKEASERYFKQEEKNKADQAAVATYMKKCQKNNGGLV